MAMHKNACSCAAMPPQDTCMLRGMLSSTHLTAARARRSAGSAPRSCSRRAWVPRRCRPSSGACSAWRSSSAWAPLWAGRVLGPGASCARGSLRPRAAAAAWILGRARRSGAGSAARRARAWGYPARSALVLKGQLMLFRLKCLYLDAAMRA